MPTTMENITTTLASTISKISKEVDSVNYISIFVHFDNLDDFDIGLSKSMFISLKFRKRILTMKYQERSSKRKSSMMDQNQRQSF